MSGFISSSSNPVVLPRAEGEGEPFGPYRLHESLGTGGMAQVFKASIPMLDGRLHKLVAVKRILNFFTEDRSFVDLLIDEARLAMRLHHPNIVQTFDIGAINEVYYIAMEFVDGPSLSDVLRTLRDEERLMPAEQAVFIAAELASALDFAHSLCDPDGGHLGVIHRDVSPQNVLISTTGQVKLIDFGVAKARDRIVKTMDGAVRGKVGYFSPERAEGDPFDHRADLFALGVILFEMLTGVHPLGKKGQMESLLALQTWEPPKLIDYRHDLSPRLSRVIERALATDPEHRYPDGEALRSDLAAILFKKHPTFSRLRLAQFLARFASGELDECLPARLVSPRATSEERPAEDGAEDAEEVEVSARPTLLQEEGAEASVDARPTLLQEEGGPTPLHTDEQPTLLQDGVSELETRLQNPTVAALEVLRYKRRSRSTLYLAIGLAVLVLIFGVFAISLYLRAERAEDQLVQGEPNPLAGVSRVTGTATLKLESSPPGARIVIHEKNTGLTTPAVLENLSAGEPLALELHRKGFESKSLLLTLDEEERRVARVALVPAEARVTVAIAPPAPAVLILDPKSPEEKRFLIGQSGEVEVQEGLRVGQGVDLIIERDGETIHTQRYVPSAVSERLDIDLTSPTPP